MSLSITLSGITLGTLALIASAGLPAVAQQYIPMSYDQQLSLAVNEMLNF